ncbi:MAG: SDR family oxidoreductase [Actinobacteria bacterium]|nr:MAG: SDR family oxidoreductase [Actinomycetota bacterium]
MARTALITGATGGLGGAVVDRFAGEGWQVVGVDKRPGEDRERVRFVEADLFDQAEVDRAVASAGDELQAVVNLVGGFAAPGRVHETPIEDFERQFTLNLRPTYLVTAAAIPRLQRGTIVCVGTRAALRPFPGAAGYVASKAALLALVRALDTEYRDEGIRINAVLPSVIDTPANRASMPDADHDTWVHPQEIAEVIHFLSSDASSPISGAEIPVYGRA